jgi:hypothetical protein
MILLKSCSDHAISQIPCLVDQDSLKTRAAYLEESDIEDMEGDEEDLLDEMVDEEFEQKLVDGMLEDDPQDKAWVPSKYRKKAKLPSTGVYYI